MYFLFIAEFLLREWIPFQFPLRRLYPKSTHQNNMDRALGPSLSMLPYKQSLAPVGQGADLRRTGREFLRKEWVRKRPGITSQKSEQAWGGWGGVFDVRHAALPGAA
jgi:hypothetical protein